MKRVALLFAAAAALACAAAQAHLPDGVQRIADVPYGDDARQRMDVYRPAQADRAPIIVMVHGGAWMIGNKRLPQVVEHKVERWVARGAVLVSIDYRLVPRVSVLEQADDVARALATVQRLAPGWGADPSRLVLMGHSAGAHLVALVSASAEIAPRRGVRPWLGTVVLDSAALNLVGVMSMPHARFYDTVFGADPALWKAASPTEALHAGAPPMLVVCSTQRVDLSCLQSERFAAAANAKGVRASVSRQDLSHREINDTLGRPGAETDDVERFFDSIGWSAR